MDALDRYGFLNAIITEKDHDNEDETYLTCNNCNFLLAMPNSYLLSNDPSFITPPLYVRNLLQLNKKLPNCKKCGHIDTFRVGVHDFTDEIAERKRREEELRLKRENAAKRIQYTYRTFIIKMHYLAKKLYKESVKLVRRCAALIIQSVGRRFLGRRRWFCEKYLVIIKNAHPFYLLEYSLKIPSLSREFNPKTSSKNRIYLDSAVFWYDHPKILSMIYDNYIVFLKRKFFKPKRYILENNIRNIALRIEARRYYLTVVLQSRWRGVYYRRYALRYKINHLLQRMRLWHTARTIQMNYRAYKARVWVTVEKFRIWQEKQQAAYLEKVKKDTIEYNKRFRETQVTSAYTQERAYERTARMTGKIESAQLHDNKKMKAFAASCYSDNSVTNYMNTVLQFEKDIVIETKLGHIKHKERKLFIYDRINSKGREWKKRQFTLIDNERIINNETFSQEIIDKLRFQFLEYFFKSEVEYLQLEDYRRVWADKKLGKKRLKDQIKEFNDDQIREQKLSKSNTLIQKHSLSSISIDSVKEIDKINKLKTSSKNNQGPNDEEENNDLNDDSLAAGTSTFTDNSSRKHRIESIRKTIKAQTTRASSNIQSKAKQKLHKDIEVAESVYGDFSVNPFLEQNLDHLDGNSDSDDDDDDRSSVQSVISCTGPAYNKIRLTKYQFMDDDSSLDSSNSVSTVSTNTNKLMINEEYIRNIMEKKKKKQNRSRMQLFSKKLNGLQEADNETTENDIDNEMLNTERMMMSMSLSQKSFSSIKSNRDMESNYSYTTDYTQNNAKLDNNTFTALLPKKSTILSTTGKSLTGGPTLSATPVVENNPSPIQSLTSVSVKKKTFVTSHSSTNDSVMAILNEFNLSAEDFED